MESRTSDGVGFNAREAEREQSLLPPPPRVQQTMKPSKNTVRTGVLVGHAVGYLINSVPKPGA